MGRSGGELDYLSLPIFFLI